MRAFSKLRSSRGLPKVPTVYLIVSMRSDVSAARVRPPVITNGRTKSCAVPRGGSSSVIDRLSLEHVLLQLRDERRTERGTDPIDEQRHLIPHRADVAAAIGHDTECAAVRHRGHEEVSLSHRDDHLLEAPECEAPRCTLGQ